MFLPISDTYFLVHQKHIEDLHILQYPRDYEQINKQQKSSYLQGIQKKIAEHLYDSVFHLHNCVCTS